MISGVSLAAPSDSFAGDTLDVRDKADCRSIIDIDSLEASQYCARSSTTAASTRINGVSPIPVRTSMSQSNGRVTLSCMPRTIKEEKVNLNGVHLDLATCIAHADSVKSMPSPAPESSNLTSASRPMVGQEVSINAAHTSTEERSTLTTDAGILTNIEDFCADRTKRATQFRELVTEWRPPTSPRRTVRTQTGLTSPANSAQSEGTESGDMDDATLSLAARAAEIQKARSESRIYTFEFIWDLLDVGLKTAVFMKLLIEFPSAEILIPTACAWMTCASLVIFAMGWRIKQLRDMDFLIRNGFCRHWRHTERLVGGGKIDPRVENDSKIRNSRHLQIRSTQAFVVDLPWAIWGIIRSLQSTEADALVLISICIAGNGFGMKLAAFNNLMKMRCLSNDTTKIVYQELPAQIHVGVGTSTLQETADAVEDAYKTCCGHLGRHPTFMIVTMHASCDHAKGLQRLGELAPGIPFAGGTTCQGVMTGPESVRDDAAVAIWALHDPEGCYATDIWQHDAANIENDTDKAAFRATKKACFGKGTEAPSFVFMMCAPGNEELVLAGIAKGFKKLNRSLVPVVGGSSADDCFEGKWRQWAATSHRNETYAIESNGCSVCFVWCSAVVHSQLLTGYSATGKCGRITKTAGLHHILEIDGRPASIVYNEWTGGEYTKQLEDLEDTNILEASALFPFGQICGKDIDGLPIYRTLHPQMFVKKTKSLTVCANVNPGDDVCMMIGTKENIVNRIANVASNVVQTAGFDLHQVRGYFVIFCAGCMLHATDTMEMCAENLDKAMGGLPYLGLHTYGEQGQFPDGKNYHGNLMFSALIFSSQRKVGRLLNVESGEEVGEDDPNFVGILRNATIC